MFGMRSPRRRSTPRRFTLILLATAGSGCAHRQTRAELIAAAAQGPTALFVRSLGYTLLALLTMGIFSQSVRASSIERVAVERMLRESSLAFEGVVTRHEPAFQTVAGSVRTCVWFDVLDVLKGATPEEEIRLCFSGGTVGDLSFVVTGSVIPKVGEWGVYFVETTEKQLVNPLFGWAQGHFRIERSDAARGVSGKQAEPSNRVLTYGRRPVLDLELGTTDPTLQLSAGVAAGVTEGSPKEMDGALDSEEFKLKIRALLWQLEE